MELDYRPASFNLSNVLCRRPEVYHQDILAAGKTVGEPGDPPHSIHDRVRFKEEGLEEKLIYDRWDRYSFMDHCLAPGTSLEQFKNNRHEALLCFEVQPYQWEHGDDPVDPQAPFVLRLQRESTDDSSREKHLAVEKTYTFDPQEAKLEVSYSLQNKGEKRLDFIWMVEHNFTLLAGDATDRNYVLPEGRLEDSRMASAGVLPDIQILGMRDEFCGFELQLKYSPAVELWRFPVETVSQSEEGFESVYQGSCIAGRWRVQLEPGQSRQVQAGLEIKKL
jgi:alpha-amylase